MGKYFFLCISFVLLGFGLFLIGRWLFLQSTFSFTTPVVSSHFSLSHAPSDSLVGQVSTVSGKVLWLSRTADKPVPITIGQPIQQGEDVIASDSGKVSVSFSTAAVVTLSPKTYLSVIQTLPADMVFNLKNGEARLEAVSSDIPVSLRGLDLLVRIEGATVVSVDPTTSVVNVTVEKGKAIIAYDDTNFLSHTQLLKKGDNVTFLNKTKKLQ